MERETVWTNADDIQRQLGRDESAARIKELEEAAINAISVMKFYAIPPQKTASQTPQRICDMQAYGLIEKIEKIMAKDAALSGARKVEL